MNLKKLLVIKNGGKDMMKNVEKDVVKKELEEELNWKEKIIVKLFKKTFDKVYDIAKKKYFKFLKYQGNFGVIL